MKKVVKLPKPIRFTEEGYRQVKEKLEQLKLDRVDAVKTLAQARAMGDLSENGFYKAAKARLSSIDHEIARSIYFLKVGKIENISNETVGIGNFVTVQTDDGDVVFNIVGDYEADPKQRKISLHSPIGSALNQKKVGDTVIVTTPLGEKRYVVKKIR